MTLEDKWPYLSNKWNKFQEKFGCLGLKND